MEEWMKAEDSVVELMRNCGCAGVSAGVSVAVNI